MVGVGNTHVIPYILAEIDGQSGVLEPDESRSQVVQQSRIEDMSPVAGHTLNSVIQGAGGAGAGSCVHVRKVGGIRCFGSGNRIVGKETIVRRNVVVEPGLEGCLIELVLPVEKEVIGEPGPGNIWERKQVDDVLTHAVDGAGWDGVAVESARDERVRNVWSWAHLAEISRVHQLGGNGADEGQLLANVGPLDRTEDEHLVFHDRPAQLAAVLVPLEAQLTGCEKVMRVKSVISQEFPPGAVQLVGA